MLSKIQSIANEFQVNSDDLIKKSVKLYIHQQLIKVESELFKYFKKLGVKSIFEMDKKLKCGNLQEEKIIDDFFAFDHLEEERIRLKKLLETS